MICPPPARHPPPQLLFPVILVFFALSLLNISGKIKDVGPNIPLLPSAVFPSFVPKAPPLLLASNPATLSLSPALASSAAPWSPRAAPFACAPGFAPAAAQLSEWLLAHPSRALPAALAFSEEVVASPLPGGGHATLAAAALLFNSTSVHALPALASAYSNLLLANASGGKTSVEASMHALPLSKHSDAVIDSFVSVRDGTRAPATRPPR